MFDSLQIFDNLHGSNRPWPPSKDCEAGGTRHIATARRFARKCSMRYDELTIDGDIGTQLLTACFHTVHID